MLMSSPQSTSSVHMTYVHITVTCAFQGQACGTCQSMNKAAILHPGTEPGDASYTQQQYWSRYESLAIAPATVDAWLLPDPPCQQRMQHGNHVFTHPYT